MRRTATRSLTAFAMIVVVVWSLIPSIPMVVAGDRDGPVICECGCGNPKGECCCVAPKTNPLTFGCSQREDPNDPVDTADGGKIIGPPASDRLSGPTRAPGDLVEPRFAFSGLALRPEIPPPQA